MKKHILLISLFLLVTVVSQAQWQPDVRLTNAAGFSFTSINNAWSIATNGDVLHVIWWDFRDGNWEIYYKRSTDGGISWGADMRLTNASNDSWNPSVSVSGQVVHVVWMDRRDGNYEIYYKRSTDDGVSWSADTRLTNNPAISGSPSASVSGQVIHVVWQDSRDGNNEIYYKHSTDEGVSWGADTRLTNAIRESLYSSVAASGQVVHVVWMDSRLGLTYEIHYMRSTNGGISWETDTRLTYDPDNSVYSSVSVSGQVVHVVWNDLRNQNSEIYYRRSTDGGISWEADTRLTNDPAYSGGCFVSVSGQVVHLVWSDDRDGNSEIYYKRNPAGNPVGITNINSEIPKEFQLLQNYPNPFNPVTTIIYELLKDSKVRLVVYDLLGREVKMLVNEVKSAGHYHVEFNMQNYASGVYFYRIEADDLSDKKYVDSKKMLLVK